MSNVQPPSRTQALETYESLGNRNAAAEILQSYERLSWYSYERGESLAQTRAHFRRIVAGRPAEDEKKEVFWEEVFTPHASQPEPAGGSSRKGKGRASLGDNDEAARGSRNEAGPSKVQESSGSKDSNETASSRLKKRRKSSDDQQ